MSALPDALFSGDEFKAPTPAVPVGDGKPTAQDLVARYVNSVRAEGAPCPKRCIGMMAKAVKELLDEDVDPYVIARAIDLLVERRLHPWSLHSVIFEAAAGPRRSKPLHGDSQDALKVALRALEDMQ